VIGTQNRNLVVKILAGYEKHKVHTSYMGHRTASLHSWYKEIVLHNVNNVILMSHALLG